MKHSLVTGGAGFIGSHLVEALLARGDRVAVIDDESTGTRTNLAAVIDHPRLRYVQGSVADRDLVRGMLDGVDEVYHLAAAVGVRLIAESPIHTIETNVYPMELLLDELGRLHAAGRTVRLVPGQQQRSLRQESQAGLVRRRRHGFWSHHAAAVVLRHVEGDRRVSRPGLLARAAVADDRGPLLQRRRSAADGRLWHGAAAAGRRGPERRAAGGPRRRPARAMFRPRRRRHPGRAGVDGKPPSRRPRIQHRQRPAGEHFGVGPSG